MSRTRRRRGAEDGFTISELMVCITLLALAFFGVATVFDSSFRMTAASSNRTLAEALASQETEALRAMPYAELGYTAAGLPSGTFEGHPYAQVDQGSGVSRTASQTRGGVVFTITRNIVWMDLPKTLPAATPEAVCIVEAICYPQAYKRTSIVVSWAEQSAKTVRQDSNVYPSGRGSYAAGNGPTPSTSNAVVEPVSGSLTAAQSTADPSSRIDLTWQSPPVSTPAGATWVIEWSLDGTFTAGRTARVTDTFPVAVALVQTPVSFAVSGLSPSTTYRFRVSSLAADRLTKSTTSIVSSPTPSGAVGSPAPSCGLRAVSISPVGIRRASTSSTSLADPPFLAVNTNGGCSSAVIQVSYQTAVGVAPIQLNLTALPSSRVYSTPTTIGTAGWDLGQHIFTVSMDPGASAAEILVSKPVLTVCPSASPVQPCP